MNANYKNGIQCKDALKFVSGTYMITAVNNGLVGKTYTICIGEQETEVTLENNYTELTLFSDVSFWNPPVWSFEEGSISAGISKKTGAYLANWAM